MNYITSQRLDVNRFEVLVKDNSLSKSLIAHIFYVFADGSSVIFRCSFGRETIVFSMPDGSSYQQLCDVIRTRFWELSFVSFNTKYILLGRIHVLYAMMMT